MISACLIVKDEIDYIEKCLQSLKQYVDEICVVDTGSTDGTIEILQKYECSIYHFDWCDDFAKARNFCLENAKHDWVLSIDADEHIREFNIDEVRKFATDKNVKKIGKIKMLLPSGNHINVTSENIPRFFNKKYIKFDRPIHEYLVPAGKYFIPQYIELPISAYHYGYLTEVYEKKSKNEKYENLLKKCLLDKYDPYLQRHLVGSYLNQGKLEEAIKEADNFLDIKENSQFFYFAEVVTLKIRALHGLKKYNEAVQQSKYFDICKNNDEYMVYMAVAYESVNDSATALDIYEYLLSKRDLNFSRLVITINIADILFDHGLYSDALDWYEKVNFGSNVIERIKICKEKIKNT